jgi:3D (Asp-Asp-Asp) domain-containing protein
MPSPADPGPESGNGMTSRTQVEEKEIPFDTQYIESDTLLPGMSQIQEEGDNGILRQVVKTFEVGGQPIDQQVQSSYELKRPKKRVVIRNSKPVVGENFELAKLKISQTLQVEATAYTYTGNQTATGIAAREGLIAVDPKVIAMGSKVYVEGYGYALAADTGGDIRGNRIDVFFATFRQCINWGRRPVHIYVLKSN